MKIEISKQSLVKKKTNLTMFRITFKAQSKEYLNFLIKNLFCRCFALRRRLMFDLCSKRDSIRIYVFFGGSQIAMSETAFYEQYCLQSAKPCKSTKQPTERLLQVN